MADLRKIYGHGYGSGPGRGGLAMHQMMQKAADAGLAAGGGASLQWMTDAMIDDFLTGYEDMVGHLSRNLSGYIIDTANLPANAAACSAADKLIIQDMFLCISQRVQDLQYTCDDARAEDGYGFTCGQGSSGPYASDGLGSTWKRPSMAWKRAYAHSGAPDSVNECLRISVAFALSATGDVYFNFSFPHQEDALDNQGAPWTGFDVGHSCFGIDELDVWLIPFPDAPTWYKKIYNQDLSLVAPLATIGTKIGDALDVTANHDGEIGADPQIAPNNWANHTINAGTLIAGRRYGIVAEARSNRWVWDGGDSNPSPTSPAFATMVATIDMFAVS